MPRLSYIGLRDLIMLVPLGFLIFERFYTTTMTVLEESNSNTVVSVEHESLLPLLMSYDLQKESRTTRNDRRRRRPVPLELLSNATAATTMTCPDGLVSIQDRHIPDNNNLQSSSSRLIPRVVHQTSKSRCMTEKMAEITKSWLLLEEEEDSSISWDYYFHDDHAMQALFDLDWPEFPHLHSILACLQHSGTMRADLWRYLVLYEYGGIYADLDTKPSAKFHASMITNTTDGFFVVEQYHILSQWYGCALMVK
jgi:mannosyltransferase OCH1-like enzyme